MENNSKSELVEALQKAARSDARSKTARLRELFDEVEAARAAGVGHQQIVETLASQGLVFDKGTYLTTRHRIATERKEKGIQPPPPPSPKIKIGKAEKTALVSAGDVKGAAVPAAEYFEILDKRGKFIIVGGLTFDDAAYICEADKTWIIREVKPGGGGQFFVQSEEGWQAFDKLPVVHHFDVLDKQGKFVVSKPTFAGAASVCKEDEKLMIREVRPDGSERFHIQCQGVWQEFDKLGDVWRRRDLDMLGMSRRDALIKNIDSRLRQYGVEEGFEGKMGSSFVANTAVVSIEKRQMIFDEALLAFLQPALDKVKAGDIAGKLKVIREKIPVVSEEVAVRWAKVDALDFSKVVSELLRESALESIVFNMKACPAYGVALHEQAPEIAAQADRFYAESEKAMLEKEARKSAEMRSMFQVSKEGESGLVTLRVPGSSRAIGFGGIPAIQSYAEEFPETPRGVVDELLAWEGGFNHVNFREGSVTISDSSFLRSVTGKTLDEAWAAAAGLALKDFEIRKAKLDLAMGVGRDEKVLAEYLVGNGLEAKAGEGLKKLMDGGGMPVDGEFIGMVRKVDRVNGLVFQSLGPKLPIAVHLLKSLEGEVVEGEVARIQFKGGRALVTSRSEVTNALPRMLDER